jgi:glycosyltransferase involved in cell wall biosynthesis
MRIGFVTTYFYPVKGGAENNCYYLARELAKHHEVHIYASGAEEKEYALENMRVHICRTIFRHKYYLALYPSLVNKVLKEEFDILHFHSLGFLQHDLALLLKKKTSRTKFVSTPHGPFMVLEYSFWKQLLRKLVVSLEANVNKLYDAVIQVNPCQTDWMKSCGLPEGKIRLLPNGVPDEIFRKINTANAIEKFRLKNRFMLTYVGRLNEYKGLDQVIRVLPALISKNPRLLFAIIGKDAGARAALEKLANELQVMGNILFLGEVSEDDKLAILDLSEIFVFPSRWEAFGIAMLEAMARRNAVISTKTEGGKYLIGSENGLLYDFGDCELLQKHLDYLLGNKTIRKKLQENNFRKSRQFLWGSLAKDLEKIYLELIGK